MECNLTRMAACFAGQTAKKGVTGGCESAIPADPSRVDELLKAAQNGADSHDPGEAAKMRHPLGE